MTSCGRSCRQSRWYSPNEWRQLVEEAEEGDQLEFDRLVYKHWAVYVGTRRYEGKMVPCVVHAAYPGDESHLGVVSRSRSLQKRANGLGEVTLEPLVDVIMESKVRINNCMDSKRDPLPQREIVRRALARCGDEVQPVKGEQYSVIWNNCEHFATECRYGEKRSQQVQVAASTATAVVGFGVVAAAAYAIFSSHGDRSNKQQNKY